MARLAARGHRIAYDGQGLVRVPRIGELTLDAGYDPELLRHLTVLKLSEDETAVLAAKRGREGALERLSGIPELLLTLGFRGAEIRVGGAVTRVAPDRVEVRETHISWVFLAGDRAYKLKKPLVLPFLDYGTPQRRRKMCREEVRLNRRLAPDVYLGVCAVAASDDGLALAAEDDPRAVDYLVEMRRYDEGCTLAAKLGRGELTRGEVVALGRCWRASTDARDRSRHGAFRR